MKKLAVLLTLFLLSGIGLSQTAPYLNNQTHTFQEAVDEYKKLAAQYPGKCHYQEFGSSDYGIPVPLFIMNHSGEFTEDEYQSKNVLLINNAIHPGEPCGVDASIKMAREMIQSGTLPKNVIIAIIPLYNVGGAHNRNCCSRANQNGPEEYGFRGNSKNLDLNRDFIKADSKNTRAFYAIFHLLKPAVFVDTHTSNGADYQHTLTLITSQTDKMNPVLAKYTLETLNPYLFSQMERENYPMVPYVHTLKKTPESGIFDYLETPRYSTGYTNLFNCISYVTEAHMLKPYEDRVNSTFLFLKHLIRFMNKNRKPIRELRKSSNLESLKAEELPLNWELDTTRFDTIPFMGYEAVYKKSLVTGHDRLFYDRTQPWKKHIKYYNRYTPTNYVKVPKYYIIPQAWDKVASLLMENDIPVYQFSNDRRLDVEVYYIADYKTRNTPYEGHYLHHSVKVDQEDKTINYVKGDYVVPTNTISVRFIVETLEPHAPDSYFAWNYFDAVLQQKEWFSAYVFEDEAPQILNDNPDLKKEFESKKENDSTFAANAFAQLYFIYKNSDHYERTSNLYPITRHNSPLNHDELEQVK